MNELSRLRLGVVPYLNVLPLLEGLEAHIPRSRWIAATPRELCGLLGGGEIDVATLPVFEVLRARDYAVLPGCAIAADGPVRSVQLFSRVPLGEIRSVLLDRSSVTSVNLGKILLRDLLEIDPVLLTSDAPIRAQERDFHRRGFDAALVIGDVALQWEDAFPHRLDLADGWKRLTGLPFVFAVWAARPLAPLSATDLRAFVDARRRGEATAAAIAAREAGAHEIPVPSLVQYLTEAIRYELSDRMLAGLEEYRRRAVAHGLLDADTPAIRLLSAEATV